MPMNRLIKNRLYALMSAAAACLLLAGCFTYSFTGVSIPSEVRTVYIPFFPDNSNSGLGFLSEDLNEALINRFVNQSRLRLSSNPDEADIFFEGTITNYRNRPFSVSGDDRTDLNRVEITVRATYQFQDRDEPEWTRNFNGVFEFDPNEDPIDGEREAALEAMQTIARNMFNDALGSW
ncbi:Lipopolysaccharide-assembly [Cyclonatronum proteinivorum]|uniref:Lipopolysaccharide-assembly n=2 Tax=Cyclonatronum proteinivorum TaxID=1457365 RepID=A0A345UK21_9BACT|nr:Lipopolysaccharide-assembly [Cyclonatronum proteinivorum]